MEGQARWRTRVTILIGVASLLGALATWRLTTVSGNAGGADAKAIDDTILVEQNRSAALVTARGEASAFARLRGYQTSATSLEALAEDAGARGSEATAQELRGTAQTLRELAVDLLDRYPSLRVERYLKKDGTRFDVRQRRIDIELNIERATRKFPAPESAVVAAASAHDDALDLGLVILGFAFAIFLFALAEKLREGLDMRLAVAGVAVLSLSSVLLVVWW